MKRRIGNWNNYGLVRLPTSGSTSDGADHFFLPIPQRMSIIQGNKTFGLGKMATGKVNGWYETKDSPTPVG